MVSPTGQSFLNLIGWAIVPDFVTHHVLRLFYSFFGAKFQRQPGTPAYRQHYAYTFSIVVLSYLTYNLIQGIRYMPLNFYQILGVPSTVDDAGLKLAFRQFAKHHHPDKPGVGKAGAELFMIVRNAFEALKDPTIRFAYDRFGPAVLSWKDCTTPGDYIRRGLFQAAGYHLVVGAALLFWSSVSQPSPVSFWRYTLFAILFMTELVLVLSPSSYSTISSAPISLLSGPFTIFNPTSASNSPSLQTTISPFTIFHAILPSQVIYQHIQFLHQLFVFLSVALSRVAPQLFPQNDPRVDVILLDRISALLAHADREASIALHMSLHSMSSPDTKTAQDDSQKSPATFSSMQPVNNPSPVLMKTLSDQMENLIVEANVRKDQVGPLRAAWEKALRQWRKSKTVMPSIEKDGGDTNLKDFINQDDEPKSVLVE